MDQAAGGCESSVEDDGQDGDLEGNSGTTHGEQGGRHRAAK
jgi:hypothetical protein